MGRRRKWFDDQKFGLGERAGQPLSLLALFPYHDHLGRPNTEYARKKVAVICLKHHFSLAMRLKRLLQGTGLRKACYDAMGRRRTDPGLPDKPARVIVEEYRESKRPFRKKGGIVKIRWRNGKEVVLLPEKPDS